MIRVLPSERCGAEVSGADLANLSLADFDQLQAAFAEHGVLFFRDQILTEVNQIEFARRLGPININRFFAAHLDHPEIAIVLKEPSDEENIGGLWHTDHSYDREPALGSVLVARDLPASGGDTLFASMYAAYDNLDGGTKNRIERLQAVHSARHAFGSAAYEGDNSSDYSGRLGNSKAADQLTDVTHPIVIAHPLSGKKALYVNPAFTIGIVGMEHGEAMKLLHSLYDHACHPDFVHRFEWEPGSVVLWDNRATWHNAMNDYPGQRREMHRITIEGCPLAAPPDHQRADPTLAQRAGATVSGAVIAAAMDGIGMVIEPERTKSPDVEIVGEAPEDEPVKKLDFGDLPEL
jgi:taurine dioxygenase